MERAAYLLAGLVFQPLLFFLVPDPQFADMALSRICLIKCLSIDCNRKHLQLTSNGKHQNLQHIHKKSVLFQQSFKLFFPMEL
jgi:hypothetical protein